MKRNKVKSILGAAIVFSALTNVNAETPKKIKTSKDSAKIIFKINDRTNDQESVSDGSKTERATK